MPSTKKSKLPSHQVFGAFALEVNEILQATPPKLRREMGMCGTAAIITYVQQCYTRPRTRTGVSCSFVPGAAYLVPGTRFLQTQNRLHNQRYGGLFRAGKLLVRRDYLIARTCYKQSNVFLMRRRRRRSAVSQLNVDPLRSTALRGIRSGRPAWSPQCTQWLRACLLYTSPSPRD